MAKLHEIYVGILEFHCPGCECSHPFHVAGSPYKNVWQWNRSYDKPTFTPSLRVFGQDGATQCHSFVTDGKIMFLADSRHELAGKTVDIPEWED